MAEIPEERKKTPPSYLPPPTPPLQPPQPKKLKLNLPSPINNKSSTTNSSSILPPPTKPNSVTSPSKMDKNDYDIRVRKKRLNSLDALVQDQIMDQSTDDEEDSIGLETGTPSNNKSETDTKTDKTEDNDHDELTIDNDKLIALVNCGSGARKGWILAQELQKYDASVYNMKDLCINNTIREKLGHELQQYLNKCIVLICGGDGSQAWAASLIDKSLEAFYQKTKIQLPFPPTCVFPMGTGNDLSRSLGWGSIEPNHKNVIQYIADIHFCAKITKRWSDLDRWRVTYTFDDIIEHDLPINDEENVGDIGKGDKSPSDQGLDKHTMNAIMNDIESNSNSSVGLEQNNESFTPRNGFSINQRIKYQIEPPKQWYIQQHPSSAAFKTRQTFDPPLPSTFVCYLSIGYDALVAYKFEQERRVHPERFNNQIKNQVMYVKHGFTEFFKPSDPITDSVDVFIDNELVSLPQACRSLKLININSAMNGLFFWGSGKSRDFEYQQQHPPRLDDSKIEVMATRGVHDMLQYRVNLSHAQRISQTNDVIIRFKDIPSTGIALQIDGEAWIIRQKCSLRIQLHDKLPVVIGYNQPRGVQSWLQASLDDQHIVKAKESFRQRLRRKYHAEDEPKEYDNESPNGSDDDKDKHTLDQSSSSIMSMFNILQKPNDETKKIQMIEMDEIKRDHNDTVVTPTSPGQQHIPKMSFFDTQTDLRTNNPSNPTLMNKINNLFQPKTDKKNSLNSNKFGIEQSLQREKQKQSELKTDDVEENVDDEVDIAEYIKNNPSVQENKNDILQSSVFSPKQENKNNGIFLDRFTWWKVTRAKNHNKAIDAEAAHDAITNDEHDSLRKTQSFAVLPKKGRSASLF